MLLKAKAVAIGGLFTALAVTCLILSGVINTSSMFFIALASFFIGTVMMVTNLVYGLSAGTATFLLGLMLVPKKTHCLTFSICAAYVLAEEFFLGKKRKGESVNPIIEWSVKVGAFIIPVAIEAAIEIYLAGVDALLLPGLFSEFNAALKILAAVVMVVLFIFILDRAYIYYSRYAMRITGRMMN
ncbi:MAG: hypothetical protein IK050_04700 [Lachnospiraceae bacterium]|nr:hypothetical protein [Lachnospiraceae bacterium]